METSQIKTIGQVLAQTVLSEDRASATRAVCCEAHGEYESEWCQYGGGFWTGCETCRQINIQAEDAERRRLDEIERRQVKTERALRRAAIPPRFADRRFETFEPICENAKRALGSIRSYANQFEDVLVAGQSLILFGTVGSGKTHLAVSVAHRVIEQGYSAIFASVMSAVRSVKETYRKGADRSEREAIEALIEPDLLILDEVGVQFGSDAEKLILFEIINGRYESMRPTIVISNLDMKGLSEYLGDRVVDRMREGGGKVVIFDWPSYRRQAV